MIITGNLFTKASHWVVRWSLLFSSVSSRRKNLTQFFGLILLPSGTCTYYDLCNLVVLQLVYMCKSGANSKIIWRCTKSCKSSHQIIHFSAVKAFYYIRTRFIIQFQKDWQLDFRVKGPKTEKQSYFPSEILHFLCITDH